MTGVVAGATVFGGLAGLAAPAAHALSSFTPTNLYGADRYASAGMNNEKAFPSGVSTVVLADGLPGHQGDALAASGYAGVNGYGVLLTDNTNTVPANTLTALTTLKVKNIIALGGPAAIAPAQIAQLTAAGYTVTQPFQGANSLGTMELINDAITPSSVGTSSSGLKTAFLASVDENHLVDALSAGGGAYALKFPVITTESSSSTLSPEAQQVITTLGIQKLIVLGGTASIPASQYTPMPTGITNEDTSATTGADRSTTSTLLATDLSKNYGFDSPLTSMILAAGATYVGNTTTLQNDGADALSSAPLGGITKSVTIVTNGPTDLGQAGNFATANASTLDPLYVVSGPADLPTSQVTTVVTDGGGTTSSTTNAYTESGGSLTLAASTSSAPSQGAETYTVTGLPTAAGTVANIALFPCTGTAQTGNGPTNGALGANSSGATTFTAPGGTSPVAGSAIGQGTSSSTAPTPTNAGYANGDSATYGSTAYIASVNGVPTTDNAGGSGPSQVYGISVTNGSVSFVLNSFQLDCAIPVVYTAPASAGGTPPLLVNANGSPQSGYAVGGATPANISLWAAPPAPSVSSPGYVVDVVLAPPTSGTGLFDGLVLAGPSGTTGHVYAFNYATSGSTYTYTDSTPLTETAFGADLSGASSAQEEPNSTTIQAVNGDEVYVGATTGYAAGAPSSFSYDGVAGAWAGYAAYYNPPFTGNPGFGDVPAAVTNVNATFNGAAYLNGTTSEPGVIVTFTPPANQDVSGAEAVTPGAGSYSASNASYQVWRSTDTNGTLSAATEIGSVNVISTGTGNNGDGQATTGCTAVESCTSISSPEFVDTSAAAGIEYVYYVTATAAAGIDGGGQTGPFSTGSTPVTAGAAAAAPTMEYAQILPGTASPAGPNEDTSVPAFPAGTGLAVVTYNEGITCASSAAAQFVYSNSNGSNASGGHAITGATCTQASTTGQVVAGVYSSSGGSGKYNGATITNAADTLIIQFPAYTSVFSAPNTYYTGTVVAAPANGDTFTYTAPASPTTSIAVYSGPVTTPAYAATQTLTSNGSNGPADATPGSDPLYS